MDSIDNNVIYKKICLEHFKSRVPGLISSVSTSKNNTDRGNWGKIPYDLDLNLIKNFNFDKLKTFLIKHPYNNIDCRFDENKKKFEYTINNGQIRLRYRNMMLWYYWVINLCKKSSIYEWSNNNANILDINGKWVIMDNFNIFDESIRNKTHIVTEYNKENVLNEDKIDTIEWNKENYYVLVTEDEKLFFDNHCGFEIIGLVESLIGKLKIPETIVGSKVPEFIYYSEIQDTFEYMDKIKNSEDCCMKEEYENMGGDEMYLLLDNNRTTTFEDNIEKYKIHNLTPYVDIPVALVCDIEDLGLMFNGEQEWIAGNKYKIGDIVTYNGDSYIAKEENNGVYNERYDEVCFDVLDENGDIKLVRWLEYIDTNKELIEWLKENKFETWENYIDNIDELKPITGESVSQLKSFRTKRNCYTDSGIEMEGVIPYEEGTNNIIKDEEGYVVLELPYTLNLIHNATTDEYGNTYGDILYYMEEENENVIRFKYVLNGKMNKNDINDINNLYGIVYEEAYIFSWKEMRDYIDNEPVKIKYRQINYSLNIDNGSFSPILSKVTYRPQDIWHADTAITAPTFRKDYLIGMVEYPTENINITIDRGLSHAFEKHLMLAETNTFNDLKNYKNNYFNLQ